MTASEFQEYCNNDSFTGFFAINFIKNVLKFDPRVARLCAVAIANHPLTNKYLSDQRSKDSISFAEQYADLPETSKNKRKLRLVFLHAGEVLNRADFYTYANVARDTSHCNSYSALDNVSFMSTMEEDTKKLQLNIITDTLQPEQPIEQQHKTTTAITLAQQIYQTKDYSTMPILADALQDADYQDEQILTKLRDINHYWFRGCYVLDTILNKR